VLPLLADVEGRDQGAVVKRFYPYSDVLWIWPGFGALCLKRPEVRVRYIGLDHLWLSV